MEEFSDRELVKAVLEGHPRAVEALVEANYARIFSLACKVLGDEEQAKDIAQDTFIRVYDRIGQFRYKSSLRTWILSITYNLCMNQLNGKDRKNMAVDHLAEVESDDGDEKFLEEQKFGIMEKALALLDPENRLIIELHYLNECSIRDMALILQKTETAAKTGLFRARQKLKALVLKEINYELS